MTVVISLRLFLTIGVAFFVTVLVAGVGGLGIFGSIENALTVKREFQAYRAETVRTTVNDYFERIEAETKVIGSLMSMQHGLVDDNLQVIRLLSALVSNLEGVEDVTLVRRDGTNVMVYLEGEEVESTLNGPLDPESLAIMRSGKPGDESEGYEDLYFEPNDLRAVTSYTLHLEDSSGLPLGTLFIDIDIFTLTDSVAQDSRADDSYVFLMDERGFIMAHPELNTGNLVESLGALPHVKHLRDPVPKAVIDQMLKTSTPLERVDTPDGAFLITVSYLPGLGDSKWLVGSAVHHDRILGDAYDRAKLIGAVGLFVLLVAVLLSLWVGRRITEPVQRLASAADAIQAFQLKLPGGRISRFSELNTAERAFLAMLRGLNVFSRYVPKSLVRRLIQLEDEGSAVQPEDREVTILFTDIAGFTTISTGMAPDDLAKMLNEYFTILVNPVLAEEGTVDKFIGDALMAFWNAPVSQPDHADRAIRAALAIRASTDTFNRERLARGEPELLTRIGVHTGVVLVGDIGTEERLNYTIVGDPVNTASRLESLGKEVGSFLCISNETRQSCTGNYPWRRIGEITLRGRSEETVIFTIYDETEQDT